jgi:F-type H+-transporting ATPase subunit b
MDLDLTLLVQLIILLTVLVGVGNLLFKPVLQVIDLREQSIAGARKDGARLVAEAEAKDAELHRALDDTRRKALAERTRLIADAQKAERQILDEARGAAQKRIDAARAELAAERAQTSTKLQAATKDLARSIASKVLLREVS